MSSILLKSNFGFITTHLTSLLSFIGDRDKLQPNYWVVIRFPSEKKSFRTRETLVRALLFLFKTSAILLGLTVPVLCILYAL
jgi:hypothetical protein